VYGVLYPLAIRFRLRVGLWFDRHGLAGPPLSVTPFFATAAILELGLLKFNEFEIAKILVGFALVIMTVDYSARRRTGGAHEGAARSPVRFDRRLVAVVVMAFILASGTLLAVGATPAGHKAIGRRFRRGIEKYAGRYARIEQWPIAAELYLKTRERKPGTPSTLRGLANCYLHMGRKDEFDCYIHEALAIDKARLAKNRNAASVNRSLVRTYRLLDDDEKAAFHLKRALDIGVERVQEHPSSGNAAYSLGKTYSLMERYDNAYKQFARAVELDPESRKFRRAMYRSKAEVQ